jgi:RNA polymerase sigma factor (sigma-70 family)
MAEVLEEIAIRHSKSLIEKSQKRDNQAYGKLVGLWFKRIYNFSLKYFGDHDLAMEVTQQTFIVAYDSIHKLRDADRFKYWLYKIALNHCRAEERKSKRRKWYSIFNNEETTNFESNYGQPEIEYQRNEEEERMAWYLKKLPEDQKVVIIMKEFDGMKFREISEALDISENTAKSRLYYGLKALRKMMINSEMSNNS